MAFKVIETQEELDNIIGERVARAKETTRKEFDGFLSPEDVEKTTGDLTAKVSNLEELLNKANETIDEQNKALADKDKAIDGHVLHTVKMQVAIENGMPLSAIDFLHGSDEDSIRASALALKEITGVNVPPMANHDAEINEDTSGAYMQMVRELRKD